MFWLFLSCRYLHLSLHSAVRSSQWADLRARCVLRVLAQRGGGPHPDTDSCYHGWMDHEHLLGNGHGHPGKSVLVHLCLSFRLTVFVSLLFFSPLSLFLVLCCLLFFVCLSLSHTWHAVGGWVQRWSKQVKWFLQYENQIVILKNMSLFSVSGPNIESSLV